MRRPASVSGATLNNVRPIATTTSRQSSRMRRSYPNAADGFCLTDGLRRSVTGGSVSDGGVDSALLHDEAEPRQNRAKIPRSFTVMKSQWLMFPVGGQRPETTVCHPGNVGAIRKGSFRWRVISSRSVGLSCFAVYPSRGKCSTRTRPTPHSKVRGVERNRTGVIFWVLACFSSRTVSSSVLRFPNFYFQVYPVFCVDTNLGIRNEK